MNPQFSIQSVSDRIQSYSTLPQPIGTPQPQSNPESVNERIDRISKENAFRQQGQK